MVIAVVLAAAGFPLEHQLIAGGRGISLLAGIILIGAIMLVSLRVAHHAEVLAEKVGEPYGTMILTISAVVVEVVILAMMMSHTSSQTLVRDTIYSAVMLDVNGILGIAAILGGIRYGEQPYNVDSGNTYIVMILTAMSVSMIIPGFMSHDHWRSYSIFTIVATLAMYLMFLRMQTNHDLHDSVGGGDQSA